MKVFKVFLLVAFCLVFSSFRPESNRLVLILVVNTIDQHLDPRKSIGPSCITDSAHIMHLAQLVAQNTGRTLETRIVRGDFKNESSKAGELRRALTVSVDNSDILWCHVSSHGGNDESPDVTASDAPTLVLSRERFSTENIYNNLKRKGAQFTLFTVDCCNTSFAVPPTRDLVTYSVDRVLVLARLFEETRGGLHVWSAKKGEFASGSANMGGFFTSSLRTAIETDMLQQDRVQDVTWNAVLTKTQNRVADLIQTYRGNPQHLDFVDETSTGDVDTPSLDEPTIAPITPDFFKKN